MAEPTPEAESDARLTVDELAGRAGLTTRTVRFYATRGLIPPPEVRGRVGYYGQRHLARLELVRRLQDYGFTLGAIEGYLRRVPADASAADVRLIGTLMTPLLPDVPEELSRAELERRVGRRLRPADLELLAAYGVLTPAGRRYRVMPPMLALAGELLELGLPAEAARRSWQVVDEHCRAIAGELQAVFLDHVWQPYRAGDRTERDRRAVRAAAQRLRAMALRSTVTALRHALNETIRDRVGEPSGARTDQEGGTG